MIIVNAHTECHVNLFENLVVGRRMV